MSNLSIYIRAADSALINSAGGELSQWEEYPTIWITQKPLVRIYFRGEGVTPWDGLSEGD